MITIFQIQMTKAQVDAFNAGQSVPAITTKQKLMFGAEKFDPNMLEYFTETMQVDTNDLEEAFELTNLWNDENRVARIGNAQSSTSVGDIFRKGDRYYMVDSFGFQELRLFNDEVEILEAA
jgi:hypothetical protein